MKESKRIPLLEVEDLKKYYPAGGGFSGDFPICEPENQGARNPHP